MYETQTAQTRLDEVKRCRERSWLAMEEENRYGFPHPASHIEATQDLTLVETQSLLNYKGLIHVGQKVCLRGDEYVGLITKLFLDADRQISHLTVRTARIFWAA